MSLRENSRPVVYTGTCLCRGIAFTVKGNPNAVYCCFCGDCALGAGGPCQITATYFSPNFTLHDPKGLATRYIITGRTISGRPKVKCFCNRCGCTIFTIPMSDGPGETVIRTVLIENGLEVFKPTVECFTKNRPSYFRNTETAKKDVIMP